jgi:hypothetical protein
LLQQLKLRYFRRKIIVARGLMLIATATGLDERGLGSIQVKYVNHSVNAKLRS